MSDDQGQSGWNENSKLVLNELKRLNHRLEVLDKQLEEKLDKTLESFKYDHRDLSDKVNNMCVELAILKREVALKTATIAFAVSSATGIVGIIIGALITRFF